MSDQELAAATDAAGQPRDLAWLAGVLDRASRERSTYMMALRAREALGLSLIEGLPDALPWPERATIWALEYHVETVDAQGRRRVRLAPAHEHDDGADPPASAEVPEKVAEVWQDLLGLVTQPPARARLHHLLFERDGPAKREHARSAVVAYIASAEDWERGMDAVQDLTAATRLARAVGERGLVTESLAAMRALATAKLDDVDPPAGIVLRALRHLVGEPDCPPEVDELLERAVAIWTDATRKDRTLKLMLNRCPDEGAREQMWRRRVAAFTEEAAAASSSIMRAVRLQQALSLAEASGDRKLRQEAAAALQTVRHEDLGLLSFHATSRQYEEEFEQQVAAVSAGESWQESLITFAKLPPLSGDTERNRDLIRRRQEEHPLAALFPTQLLGPDNLPAYTGTSAEDRFDVDLVRWETDLIGGWFSILAAGLHEIPCRHGVPDLQDISTFLASWPAVDNGLAPYSPERCCATGLVTAKAPLTRSFRGSNPSSGASFCPPTVVSTDCKMSTNLVSTPVSGNCCPSSTRSSSWRSLKPGSWPLYSGTQPGSTFGMPCSMASPATRARLSPRPCCTQPWPCAPSLAPSQPRTGRSTEANHT